jgi:hypothetical protein
MKKRTKADGQFKRFYASGIPMYRWRKQSFPVAANTMVNVLTVKTATAICEVKTTKEQKAELGVDSIILSIPNDNFLGDKLKAVKAEKAVKPAKKGKGKKAAPVVASEPTSPAETTVPVVAIEAPATATATEAAPEIAPAPAAETQPAGLAAV